MKKYLVAIWLPLFFVTLFAGLSDRAAAFNPFRVNDDPTVCNQTNAEHQQSPVCTPVTGDPITGKDGVLTKIANIFAFITGVAVIIIIMISGFEYVRSGGDSAKISKAKNGILFAIIGLVVVVLARSIVLLVISKLS